MNEINTEAALAALQHKPYHRFGRTVTVTANSATIDIKGKPILTVDYLHNTITVHDGVEVHRQWMRLTNTVLGIFHAGHLHSRQGALTLTTVPGTPAGDIPTVILPRRTAIR